MKHKLTLSLLTSEILNLISVGYAYAAITNDALNLSTTDPGAGFALVFGRVWKSIVIIGALAFLVYFLMAGLDRVTAGGDKAKLESSTKKMTNAIIGLVFLVSSFAVAALISAIFKIDLLNITWPTI